MASTARALVCQAVFPRAARHSTSSQAAGAWHPLRSQYSHAIQVRPLAFATHKAAMRSDCASIFLFLGRSVTHQQCRPQLSKSSSSATVGQEAVVPYAHQSLGQDVQQEPSNKLLAAQGHLSGSRTLAVPSIPRHRILRRRIFRVDHSFYFILLLVAHSDPLQGRIGLTLSQVDA